jgi:hypothetical protein
MRPVGIWGVLILLQGILFWGLAQSLVLKPGLRHFINLTNGIEVIPQLLANGVRENEINYIRLQSTHCESRNYNGIIESLDATLLMSLARGDICLLYDYGSRGTGSLIGEDDEKYGIPRAYWMGVEYIRHTLASVWNLEESGGKEATQVKRYVRGYNSGPHFDEQIAAMPKTLRRKLKYFRPYVATRHLHLYPIYRRTLHDADKQFHVDTMTSSLPSVEIDTDTIDEYIEKEFLPSVVPDMQLYRSEDFMGLGRNN